jgi:hypothetical protein
VKIDNVIVSHICGQKFAVIHTHKSRTVTTQKDANTNTENRANAVDSVGEVMPLFTKIKSDSA